MALLRPVALAALVTLALLTGSDLIARAAFPSPARLSANFSPAMLELQIDRLRTKPPQTIFLGDSVLWGYKISPGQTAATRLFARGLEGANFSYEGGSPVNTYAMLELMLARGVRPKRVVFNVNQKEFNPFDSAYRTIHPSVAVLAEPLLSPGDRALLRDAPAATSFDATLDRSISGVWKLYALRADLREMLFGDVDAAHALDDVVQRASGAQARIDAAHLPTPDKFDSTYDLGTLDDSNVAEHFFTETIALLRREHIPAIAILTPTNHRLLHEYIDVPAYRAAVIGAGKTLAAGGIGVVDLDAAFPANEFIDNDHLTPAGNERLMNALWPHLATGGAK